jgi:LytS/YehU family sensor histidine kinase
MAVFRLFYFCTSIFAGLSFLYFGIKMMSEISERRVRLARGETARKDAELKMLRAQMAPHFLFNALNAIRAGIDQRAKR